MADKLLYLSRADVERLMPQRSVLRNVIAEAIQATAAGQLKFEPKATLAYATGHSFQSMPALVSDGRGNGFATIKWVSVVPVSQNSNLDNIHSIICVNDLATGQPLAIMDGNYITLVRTAALSALAAHRMYPGNPLSIGFIGCGQQAKEHLLTFCDLYPSLQSVFCFSRSEQSAQNLAAFASEHRLEARGIQTPDEIIENCNIVISTVPAAPGLQPFLDARQLSPHALAIMVDLGRSWIPESFTAFHDIATDSLHQSRHPYDNQGNELTCIPVKTDLETLTKQPVIRTGRKAFFFKGIASADLAVAKAVYQRAVELNAGVLLRR